MTITNLGPAAGHDGGRLVFPGTPSDLVARGDTLTARHLRDYVAGVSVIDRASARYSDASRMEPNR